jgi:hypothetical protein
MRAAQPRRSCLATNDISAARAVGSGAADRSGGRGAPPNPLLDSHRRSSKHNEQHGDGPTGSGDGAGMTAHGAPAGPGSSLQANLAGGAPASRASAGTGTLLGDSDVVRRPCRCSVLVCARICSCSTVQPSCEQARGCTPAGYLMCVHIIKNIKNNQHDVIT